jgi:hypothetical protein
MVLDEDLPGTITDFKTDRVTNSDQEENRNGNESKNPPKEGR